MDTSTRKGIARYEKNTWCLMETKHESKNGIKIHSLKIFIELTNLKRPIYHRKYHELPIP
jgi:hypothetical protein